MSARMIRPALLTACLVVACLVLACGPAGPRWELPEDGARHVVLVLVDQLRKDAADEWMPGLGALAERGVVFESMRSTAPWTYPSVLSLFSGLYPQQHGADGRHKDNWLMTFDPSVLLLHEVLKEAGFTTAGFVTNPFLNPWNSFHEGFDHYDTSFIGDTANLRGKPKEIWTNSMFADTVNPRVMAHFAERPLNDPEFTYVHYIDVHGPFDDSPFEHDGAVSSRGGYENAVRWMDARLVELHAFFAERYGEDMLFVVTSDHGQALGDDETIGEGRELRRTKKTMHEFNLRVPFVVLPGARVPAGVRVTADASNVDALPTLLSWIGLDAALRDTESHEGVLADLPGVDWYAAVREAAKAADDAGAGAGAARVVAEAPARARPIYARMSAFGWQTDALVRGETKFVRRFEAGFPTVTDSLSYALPADPREIAPSREPFGAQVDAALREASDTHGRAYPPLLHRPGSENEAQLEALGYLQGDADASLAPEIEDG